MLFQFLGPRAVQGSGFTALVFRVKVWEASGFMGV